MEGDYLVFEATQEVVSSAQAATTKIITSPANAQEKTDAKTAEKAATATTADEQQKIDGKAAEEANKQSKQKTDIKEKKGEIYVVVEGEAPDDDDFDYDMNESTENQTNDVYNEAEDEAGKAIQTLIDKNNKAIDDLKKRNNNSVDIDNDIKELVKLGEKLYSLFKNGSPLDVKTNEALNNLVKKLKSINEKIEPKFKSEITGPKESPTYFGLDS